MPDSPTGPTRVVVVGGGIAGLAAAHRLVEEPGLEVIVLEGSDRVGGKLALAEIGGVRVDVGAESMLYRRPEATALARAVGLGDDLVHPAATKAKLWNRDRLVPMPRTLMGIPGDLHALDGVLSAKGLARAAMDAVLPATQVAPDISVGALVEERFGKEVLDRLVEPLLGGVYAGHARALSLHATMPQVLALLDRNRSLSRGAAAALDQAAAAAPTPVFAGLRGGVGRLPLAIADVLRQAGAVVRTGAMVRALTRRPGGGWDLVVGSTRDPEVVGCDAVVLALPAAPAARLLGEVAPGAALGLARIEYASMAIVTLAVPATELDTVPGVAGSGFLVPPVDGHQVKAATYSFAKWDWVREAGGDLRILRASIGRHREETMLQADDEHLVEVAAKELTAAVGAPMHPVAAHVQRWGGALPQYAVGHLDRVAAIRREVASEPGLAVCGAAYDGLGIPACIASAHLAAEQIVGLVRLQA